MKSFLMLSSLATLAITSNTLHRPLLHRPISPSPQRIKRDFLTCEQTYGLGSMTCGNSGSHYCYNPLAGESCCPLDNGYCLTGDFCAPVVGFCCHDGEDPETCATRLDFILPSSGVSSILPTVATESVSSAGSIAAKRTLASQPVQLTSTIHVVFASTYSASNLEHSTSSLKSSSPSSSSVADPSSSFSSSTAFSTFNNSSTSSIPLVTSSSSDPKTTLNPPIPYYTSRMTPEYTAKIANGTSPSATVSGSVLTLSPTASCSFMLLSTVTGTTTVLGGATTTIMAVGGNVILGAGDPSQPTESAKGAVVLLPYNGAAERKRAVVGLIGIISWAFIVVLIL